ncbi:MAG TPA: DUF2795 domain-containing protein [Streptosporangiaceae bacterium]|nr:DUF2795 domain-containing protein [Streptosporangiaceae bacterium]
MSPNHPVSRTEIHSNINEAFIAGSATRADMLEAARASSARPEVVGLLQQLPERRFNSIRQIWAELPDLPVEV